MALHRQGYLPEITALVPRIAMSRPPLCLFVSKDSVARVHLPLHLAEQDLVSASGFNVSLETPGNFSLIAAIGGSSLTNSPISIQVTAKECNGVGMVNTGGTCVCPPGYQSSGTDTSCVPCLSGRFQPETSSSTGCRPCPNGFFSNEVNSGCISCSQGAIKCRNGNIRMTQGFWCEICAEGSAPRSKILERLYSASFPTVFHACSPKEACVNNASSFETKCAEGYTGPVCSKCIRDYSKAADGSCRRCRSTVKNAALATLSMLVAISIVVGITLRAHKDNTETNIPATISNGRSDENTRDHGRDQHESKTDIIAVLPMRSWTYNLKSFKHALLIYLDYLQIMRILHSMKISPFHGIASWISNVARMSTLNPAEAGPFRCLTGFGPLHISLATMVLPAVLIVTVLMTALVVQRLGSGHFTTGRWLGQSIWAAILLLNLVYMSVSMMTVRSFQTYPKLIQDSERSALDLSIRTDSRSFAVLQGVSITMLVVFVSMYPLGQAMYFLRRYKHLRSTAEAVNFWKLTGGYYLRSYGFLWEVVVMIRKLLLVLAAVSMTDAPGQFTLTTIVLLMSYMLLLVQTPYVEPPVDCLQRLLVFATVVNAVLGVIRWEAARSSCSICVSGASTDGIDQATLTVQIVFTAAALVVVGSLSPRAVRAFDAMVLDRIRRICEQLATTYLKDRFKQWCSLSESFCKRLSPARCLRQRRGTETTSRMRIEDRIPEPTGGINPLQTADLPSSKVHHNIQELPDLDVEKSKNGCRHAFESTLAPCYLQHPNLAETDDSSTSKRVFAPTKPTKRKKQISS
eukprot:gb/GECG01000277.1/.p1 GENE.gb/GECG01000277.1/~~gb/GECG01000277.1/.p1  ORF type:complete len:801 (+),score=27.15 gb/GECG01000277.1/:1-2403(+)